MTQPAQPTCPNCGTPLAVTLAIPGPLPGAPVPQPTPAPSRPTPDLAGQVYTERDGQWMSARQDPYPYPIGPDVYAAPGPYGALPDTAEG